MVCYNAARDLDVATRGKVAGCGLEEEERLLRDGVVQLFDMVSVVATDGNYLQYLCSVTLYAALCVSPPTFLPCLRNAAAAIFTCSDEPGRSHRDD